MKLDILISSARVYEKNGSKNTRLVFLPIQKENFISDSKMIGYSDLAEYYDKDILKNVPNDLILVKVTGLFEEIPYQGNPFKKRSKLVGIEYEGKVYNFI